MTTISQRVLELKADGEDYNFYPQPTILSSTKIF